MTNSHLRLAVAMACGLAVAIGLLALIDHFGNAFMSRRMDTETESPAVSLPSSVGVMSLHEKPQTIPDIRFKDASGRHISLEHFRPKVVLLNIWATWCVPCRREMPTLDRLQAELSGPDFEVVALSIDRAGIDVVRKFYAEIGMKHLAMYIDSSGKAARELGAVGLPTTLLIARDGREIGRLVGPAEWDAPEMATFIRNHLARERGSLATTEHRHAAVHDNAGVGTDFEPLRTPVAISSATTKETDP